MKLAFAYIRAHAPAFIAQRKKAIVGFAAPIVAAQLARFVPGVHIDISMIEQLLGGLITGALVHWVPNSPTAVTPTANTGS